MAKEERQYSSGNNMLLPQRMMWVIPVVGRTTDYICRGQTKARGEQRRPGTNKSHLSFCYINFDDFIFSHSVFFLS